MEFKIGDKVNINPESAYLLQGMKDGYYMDGIITTAFYSTKDRHGDSLIIHVRCDDCSKNGYSEKDLISSVEEHRDKQLNKLFDLL